MPCPRPYSSHVEAQASQYCPNICGPKGHLKYHHYMGLIIMVFKLGLGTLQHGMVAGEVAGQETSLCFHFKSRSALSGLLANWFSREDFTEEGNPDHTSWKCLGYDTHAPGYGPSEPVSFPPRSPDSLDSAEDQTLEELEWEGRAETLTWR